MKTEQYQFRAFGPNGEVVEVAIGAPSAEAATEIIWARGLTPFDLPSAPGTNAPRTGLPAVLRRRQPSLRDLALFTTELAALIGANLAIDDSLRVLTEHIASNRIAPIIERLLAAIIDGSSLSEALGEHAIIFNEEYVSIVRAGEGSGKLAEALDELGRLIERRAEMSARIATALIYPAILIFVALLSVGVLAGVLVPNLAPLIARGNRPLPIVMQIVMAAGAYQTHVLACAGLLFSTMIGVMLAIRHQPRVRLAFDRMCLTVPFFGTLAQQTDLARFTRTLGSMLKARVPIVNALIAACSVMRNTHIRMLVEDSIGSVRDGKSLARALEGTTGFTAAAMRLIAVGESTGKLDHMLLRIAMLYEQQCQRRIDRFMALLTPSLTLGIAALIGAIILGVMNAIMAVNDVVLR